MYSFSPSITNDIYHTLFRYKKHVTDMYHKRDEAHLKVMGEIQELMKSPDAMDQWFADKKKEFDSLPDNG